MPKVERHRKCQNCGDRFSFMDEFDSTASHSPRGMYGDGIWLCPKCQPQEKDDE